MKRRDMIKKLGYQGVQSLMLHLEILQSLEKELYETTLFRDYYNKYTLRLIRLGYLYKYPPYDILNISNELIHSYRSIVRDINVAANDKNYERSAGTLGILKNTLQEVISVAKLIIIVATTGNKVSVDNVTMTDKEKRIFFTVFKSNLEDMDIEDEV